MRTLNWIGPAEPSLEGPKNVVTITPFGSNGFQEGCLDLFLSNEAGLGSETGERGQVVCRVDGGAPDPLVELVLRETTGKSRRIDKVEVYGTANS
jgi:hypothetical protein